MIISVLMIALNFILYFLFGSLVTHRALKEGRASISLTLLVGFFLYYSLFTVFCLPVMYRWRPLSMLAHIWAVVMVVVSLVAIIYSGKYFKKLRIEFDNKVLFALCIVISLVEVAIILYSYQFTLDAAYYVANVGTSVETNMMNVYDPYTGDWQDHFQMRYFFATYPQNDAVMCYLFGIHPLEQTKLVMAAVSVFLANIVYLLIAREIFGKRDGAVTLFLLFSTILHFFCISIYTSSNFMVTRTYEGKNILANIILPAIFYVYIKLVKENDKTLWWMLFIICFGATVVSNSSNMLVPAALAVFMLPLAIMKKDIMICIKAFACALPCLIMMAVYIAYVKGIFVLYTYPR